MSKPLRSYTNQTELRTVIARRIKEATGGLGYLSALAASKILFKKEMAEKKAEAEEQRKLEEMQNEEEQED